MSPLTYEKIVSSSRLFAKLARDLKIRKMLRFYPALNLEEMR